MTEYIEQTSASDRYEAARKALDEWEALDRDCTGDSRPWRPGDALAGALRALITPPSVGEDEGEIAERAIRSEFGDDWSPDRLYVMNIYELAEACVRAGIQAAHEVWEPEVALRPTQEQMLRWLEIEYDDRYNEAGYEDGYLIIEQFIEREED